MRIALALLIFAIPAFAQTAPDTPQYFTAVGAGFNQAPLPQVNGWVSIGVKVANNTYSYTTTEYTRVNSTVRTGVAQVVFQKDGLTLMALGDGGVATGGSGLATSFSFGGVVAYDISKYILKIPNTHVMFSARPIKTNTPEEAGGGFHTAFQFGFAKTF